MIMWSKVTVCLILGLALCQSRPDSDHAYKFNTEYKYEVHGRALTGLSDVANHYSGIVIRAHLTIRQKDIETLSARVYDAEVSDVHSVLPGDWESEVPSSELSYRSLPLSNQPFEIQLNNSAIKQLVVNKNVPNWEVNMLKAIVSQIQIDLQAQNLIKSRYNQRPNEPVQDSATFKTMEETITGKTETVYEVFPLPEEFQQMKPQIHPLNHLKGDGQIIGIVKRRDYSNSDERVGYNFGLPESSNWEPGTTMEDYFTTSSMSRIVISGHMKRYTIQSAVTTTTIMANPNLAGTQKGIIGSRINVTLASVSAAQGEIEELEQPTPVGNLVYSYNDPFSKDNSAQHREYQSSEENEYSSSEEQYQQQNKHKNHKHQYQQQQQKRTRRSANKPTHQQEQIYSKQWNTDDVYYSSSSASASHEEYYWQPQPNNRNPPQNPFQPLTVGNQGKSVRQAIDLPKKVQELVDEVAKNLQNPKMIIARRVLAQFIILSDAARNMNVDELQSVGQELWQRHHKHQNEIHTVAWKVYRDVVAHAGTGPALLTIEAWIRTHKIREEEAAQVIGVQADVARNPNKQYMDAFFKLVTDETVQQTASLNDTILLTFSNLARKAHVNRHQSHNNYPVHSFGPVADKKHVVEKYIPYYRQQLEKAFDNKDMHKIHVFIRALGNFAHPQILEAYKPYLEGQRKATNFQRVLMIMSMNEMAKVYPEESRSVLNKVYFNLGDSYEVRTAAVYQLIRTQPSASMLQRMAEYTRLDLNKQVNSAVKSTIQYAAKLESPRYAKLATAARSAVHLLNSEDYGSQYSHNFLLDYVQKEINFGYKETLQYIGSQDNIIPKAIYYSLNWNKGGLQRNQMTLHAMVSSVQELVSVVQEQVEERQKERDQQEQNQQEQSQSSQQKHHQSSQWAQKVAKLLDIQMNRREQLEGSLMISTLTGQRFFSIHEQSVQEMTEEIMKNIDELVEGKRFNYTKFYNQDEMVISGPTELGIPFFFTYNKPILVNVGGSVQMYAQNKESQSKKRISVNNQQISGLLEVEFVVSRYTQSEMGLVTPYDHQQYIASYEKNAQVYLPVSAKINVDINKKQLTLRLAPTKKQDHELFHYSTLPFTTKSDIFEFQPASLSKNSHFIYHSENEHKMEREFGKSTGVIFHLRAGTDKKLFDQAWFLQQARQQDSKTALISLALENSIQYTVVELSYDSQKSTAEYIELKVSYKTQSNKHGESYSQQSEDSSEDEQQSSRLAESLSSDESEQRQRQILKKTVSGIRKHAAQSIDIAVSTPSRQNAWIATAAFARSQNNEKARALFFYQQKQSEHTKQYQVCMSASTKTPQVPEFSYNDALNADASISAQFQLSYGQNCQSGSQVNVKAELEKSEERKSHLQYTDIIRQCKQEMRQGNKQMPACANATVQANYMDRANIEVNFSEVSKEARNYTEAAYSALRAFYYPYLQENKVNASGSGQQNLIKIQARFEPRNFDTADVVIQTPNSEAQFKNVRISQYAKPLVQVHPSISLPQRIKAMAFNTIEGQGTCVLDHTEANTLDNRTYSVHLGRCYHVVLHAVQYKDNQRQQQHSQEQSQQQQSQEQSQQQQSQEQSQQQQSQEQSQQQRPHKQHQNKEQQRSYTIMVRDAHAKNHKELKIVLQNPQQHESREIDLIPLMDRSGRSSKVFVSEHGSVHNIAENSIFEIHDVKRNQVATIRYTPQGEVKVQVHNVFTVVFDGQRAKISVHDQYRNQVRGLCGNFDGEIQTDYTSPKNCNLRDERHFAASYAIVDGTCEGPAKELHAQAKQQQCAQHKIMFANVVSQRDSHSLPKRQQQQENQQRSDDDNCSIEQTRYVEEENTLCFTVRPMKVCASHCRPHGQVQTEAKATCVQRTPVSELWKKQIDKGASPDFSSKKVHKVIKVQLPKSCRP